MTSTNDTQKPPENQAESQTCDKPPKLPGFVQDNLKPLQIAAGVVFGLLTDYFLMLLNPENTKNGPLGYLWVVSMALFIFGARKIENTYNIVLKTARIWYIICIALVIIFLLAAMLFFPDILPG